MINRIIQFTRTFLRREQNENELDNEIQFHLERDIESNIKAGMSMKQAKREAKQSLGGLTQIRELCRDVRPGVLLETILQDVRYALRAMRKNLTFSVVAILTLALGIGASTAIFSVVDGVLLRPMPFDYTEELCVIWETDRDSGTIREPASMPDYLDYRLMSEKFADIGALLGQESTFTAEGMAPTRIDRLMVSESLAPMLGMHPMLGRGIADYDVEDYASVVVLSERFWRSRFSADPNVIGQTVQVDDEPFEVIGVMPREADFGVRQVMEAAAYSGTFAGTGRRSVDIWTPLTIDPQILPRSTHPIFMLGRLAKGVSIEAAQLEMATIASDLETQYPENNARGVFVESLSDVVLGSSRPALLLLLGAVAMVLLVACVNVVNLLLARSSAREHEIAVRSALGAGSGRLARQFFVESAAMTLIAAALGVGLALGGLNTLLALAPADLPRLDSITIDTRVLVVTLLVSTFVAILFGMAPTIKARRIDVRGALTASERGVVGAHGAHAKRSALVVAEITFAVILVSTAGLLIRSFWTLQNVDPGYRAEGVLKTDYSLPTTRYPRDFSNWPDWPAQQAFLDSVTVTLRATPGVKAVAITANHPVDRGWTNSWAVVGREEEARNWPEISVRIVSPGYLRAVQLQLFEGRGFLDSDNATADRAALVNQSAVTQFFPDDKPIGESIRIWGQQWHIVGVVGNERIHGLDTAPPPAVYFPYAQAPPNAGSILVRTTGNPMDIAPAVRAAVAAHDPQLAVFDVEPLRNTLADSLGRRRFTMLLLGLFGAVALTLMVVGIHGVLSYAVAQQMPELGIMLALGAGRDRIVWIVVRRGLRLAVPGILLGIAGTVAVSKIMNSLLFDFGPRDALTLTAVIALVLIAAIIATLLPARRAAGADPLVAIRCE